MCEIWTETDRQAVMRLLRSLTPEQQAQFPEEVRRGDRSFTSQENQLWHQLLDEWTYQKQERLAQQIKGLKFDQQAQFSEEVRRGERPLTASENRLLEQFTESNLAEKYPDLY